MFKIGDFAKLGRVSVKALRIYDERGLLKPARIDRFTDYRYYAAEQLPRLHRILALKSLGFSLDEVKQWLDEPEPSERFNQALQRKHTELTQAMRDEQMRLTRIEAQLNSQDIHKMKNNSPITIEIKKIEPQLVASARDGAPSQERLNPIFNRLYDQIFGYLMFRHGMSASDFGDAIAIYHGWDPHIDIEATVPIYKAVPSAEHAKIYTLPGIEQAACATLRGPLTQLSQTYETITRWIESNGYRIAGAAREVSHVCDISPDGDKWVIEVQMPIAKM
jgi:DNA-binding transcriptional MerR regulator